MGFRVYMALTLIGVCLAVVSVAVVRRIMNMRRRTSAADDSVVSPAAANAGSVIRIRPEAIPEELQSLIPLAERWGISDDAVRLGKIRSATHAEREELLSAVRSKRALLTRWLTEADVTKSPDRVALAFMDTAAAEIEAMGKNL